MCCRHELRGIFPIERAFPGTVSLSCGTFLTSYLFWAETDSARKGMTSEVKWPQKREGWRWGEKRGRSKNNGTQGQRGRRGESEAVESRLEMERRILGSRETSEKKGS